MAAITRLGFFGYGVRRVGSFLRPTVPVPPANIITVTTTNGVVTLLATMDGVVTVLTLSEGVVSAVAIGSEGLVSRVTAANAVVTNATVTEYPL